MADWLTIKAGYLLHYMLYTTYFWLGFAFAYGLLAILLLAIVIAVFVFCRLDESKEKKNRLAAIDRERLEKHYPLTNEQIVEKQLVASPS